MLKGFLNHNEKKNIKKNTFKQDKNYFGTDSHKFTIISDRESNHQIDIFLLR